MRVLFAICLIGIGLVVGCGGGPTAPKAISGAPDAEVTPAPPAPTPEPCRPLPKCLDQHADGSLTISKK